MSGDLKQIPSDSELNLIEEPVKSKLDESPEICIKSPEICIKSPEICIKSPEICIKSPETPIKRKPGRPKRVKVDSADHQTPLPIRLSPIHVNDIQIDKTSNKSLPDPEKYASITKKPKLDIDYKLPELVVEQSELVVKQLKSPKLITSNDLLTKRKLDQFDIYKYAIDSAFAHNIKLVMIGDMVERFAKSLS